MHLPSPASLALLAYLFVFLPWGAWKSAIYLDRARARKELSARREGVSAEVASEVAMPSLGRIYGNTLINMGLLLLLAFLAAREAELSLFAVGAFGLREFVACLVWFTVSFTVGLVSRWWRTPEELRRMAWMVLVPRTRNQWLGFVAVAIAAGVCEEAAYRGMAFNALHWSTGSATTAALLSAFAFALAHRVQGYKSMAIVFVKGLLLQVLVWYTGTLVGAMVGHAVLDVVTAYRSSLLRISFEREDAVAGH